MCPLLIGQYLMAVLGHKHHDLPLGRRLSILGIDRPAVSVVHIDAVRPHVHHGLDGKDHG